METQFSSLLLINAEPLEEALTLTSILLLPLLMNSSGTLVLLRGQCPLVGKWLLLAIVKETQEAALLLLLHHHLLLLLHRHLLLLLLRVVAIARVVIVAANTAIAVPLLLTAALVVKVDHVPAVVEVPLPPLLLLLLLPVVPQALDAERIGVTPTPSVELLALMTVLVAANIVTQVSACLLVVKLFPIWTTKMLLLRIPTNFSKTQT